VQETEAFRVYLGLEKFALAGHCYGGFIAMKYAIKYPDRVEALLVTNTSPYLLLGDTDIWMKSKEGYNQIAGKLESVDLKSLTPEEGRRAGFKNWFPVLHFYNYSNVAEIFDKILDQMIISVKPPQYFEQHEYTTYDIRDDLGNIKVPTLIAVGDDDFPFIKIGSDLLQKGIANSRLVVIENCGHWLL